jgi:CHAD domain-containing protein
LAEVFASFLNFSVSGLIMALDVKLTRQTFQRTDRELAKLVRKLAPARVHKFRTSSRRVEAVLSELAPELHRNDERLLKMLSGLRKKAGRVRDLDVQIAALRALKFPQANGHKSQLMDALVAERSKREKKLARVFDEDKVAEIRKRLKRAARQLQLPATTDPLALTLRKLRELSANTPRNEEMLHQYRIIGKRARYLAELSRDDPQGKSTVDRLKHMQDVIGDWHDWLKLTQRAEELLGNIRDSALVAMLRNVTQAKFRQGMELVAQIRSEYSASAQPTTPSAKSPAKDAAQATAA